MQLYWTFYWEVIRLQGMAQYRQGEKQARPHRQGEAGRLSVLLPSQPHLLFPPISWKGRGPFKPYLAPPPLHCWSAAAAIATNMVAAIPHQNKMPLLNKNSWLRGCYFKCSCNWKREAKKKRKGEKKEGKRKRKHLWR